MQEPQPHTATTAPTLEGKTILITGGSMGLGYEICRQLTRANANIIICSRTNKDLQLAKRNLKALGHKGKIWSKTCDISNPEDTKQLAAFVESKTEKLHGIVMNAGVYGPMGPIETLDTADWCEALSINLTSIFLLAKYFVPKLKAQGEGKIVIISGGGASAPLPNISAYAASKAGAVRLAETLAEELKPFNIQVNAVAPGPMATRMMSQAIAAGPSTVGQGFYDKNLAWQAQAAGPEKGAKLVLYLLATSEPQLTGLLISAQWDPWETLEQDLLTFDADTYKLRRTVPKTQKI